jgi:dihydroorotate dehydrogenase (NAD+) catalytic subunit
MWRFTMASRIGVKLGNLELSSPLIAASGCYGYGAEYAEIAPPTHLGGFITKSISMEPWKGNPPPRISEVDTGLLNSIGLANMGVEAFKSNVASKIVQMGSKAIVSVACKVMEEYEEVVAELEDIEGLAGYELNISCPNVKEGGMAFSQNPTVTEELVKRVRNTTNRWITTKLTPNVATVADGAKAAENGGADAISLINTVVGMAVDWRTRRPKLSTLMGGYSGPPIKPIALAKVWQAYNAVSIPVIGLGGIVSWSDVLEFMIVGSSAVQIGTALYSNPALPEQINAELEMYLEAEGISSISEIVGTLDKDNPLRI